MSEIEARVDADGRPVSGRWFEELTEGLLIHHALRRTITESDNIGFSTLRRVYTRRHGNTDTEAGRDLLPDL